MLSFIFGVIIFSVSVLFVLFGLSLFAEPKASFEHNSRVTGSLKNALVGDINNDFAFSSDEISKGFTIDTRNGELVACSQLSREAINT